MGTFSVELEVASLAQETWQKVDCLVDTGATYSVLPAETMRQLGIVPHDQRPFVLANDQRQTLDVGHVWIRLQGRSAIVLAVFGTGSQRLLGAVTLEALGLAVDPVRKRLVPVDALLM